MRRWVGFFLGHDAVMGQTGLLGGGSGGMVCSRGAVADFGMGPRLTANKQKRTHQPTRAAGICGGMGPEHFRPHSLCGPFAPAVILVNI